MSYSYNVGKREILNQEAIIITIERLCYQLIESHNTFDNVILIGIQPRGADLNKKYTKN